MNSIDPNDPFWKIIAYLNDNNMQYVSKVWKTEVGYMQIYFGKYGWERRMLEVSEWPIGDKS